MPPSGTVVISDASAVRALAHPARLAVIDALYAGQVLTATECAALAGISPSAMSYHLRTLERHGIVRRAQARGDGRQRPWERTGDDLSISLRGTEGSRAGTALAAADLLVETSLQRDLTRLLATMRAEVGMAPDDPWARTTTYSRDQLVLTPEEATALHAALEQIAAQYRNPERQTHPPAGSARFAVSFLLAREVDPA